MTTDELAQLNELKQTKIHRLENESYRYYSPIGKAQQFIDNVGNPANFVNLFSAANGVGKTMVGANILAHLFWGGGGGFFKKGSLFSDWPASYPKVGRIVSEPNTIMETIVPMLKETFPKGRYGATRYSTNKDGKRFESHWETDTGWSFNLMTYDQEVKEFESATLGFVWEDEPPTKAIHDANIARIRQGNGTCFITETPLSGSAWIYDDFILKNDEQLKKERKTVVTAELEDACIEHGIRGFIPHEKIEFMISQYDPDERPARAFGTFTHLSGLILKKWNRQVHVIRPFKVDPKNFVVVHALDPHGRNADAALWVAIDRYGNHYVVDEMAYQDYATESEAQSIRSISNSYRVVRQIIDPSAFNVDQHTGHSLAADLAASGLSYAPASKQRAYATQLIKDYLDYEMVADQLIRPPKLYVFSTCEGLIWQIEHWQWENWRSKNKETKDPKERPMDKDDHFIEDLGRVLLEAVIFEEEVYTTPYQPAQQNPANQLDPYD